MSQGLVAQRFREHPVIWQAAVRKAKREGTTISAILRQRVREYLGPDCPEVPESE